MSSQTTDTLSKIRKLLFGILLILIAQVAYFAQDVVMPIVLGLIIAFTLSPLVRAGRRIGIPEALSAILVIAGFVSFVTVVFYVLSGPFTDLVNSAPRIQAAVDEKLAPIEARFQRLRQAGENAEGPESVQTAGTEEGGESEPPAFQLHGPDLANIASGFAGGATKFAIAILLALFLLSTGPLFYEGVVKMYPSMTDKKRALRILYNVEKEVSRYLLTITLINIGLGATIGALLYLYDMPNAILWGAIATMLNFLPYVGAIIGASALGLTALAEYMTIGQALVPVVIYYACTSIEGNLITPYVVGRRLEMNVVSVFVAVLIWGWMWGVVGALMAVPLLVILKVMSDNIDGMRSFGRFLSAPKQERENGEKLAESSQG